MILPHLGDWLICAFLSGSARSLCVVIDFVEDARIVDVDCISLGLAGPKNLLEVCMSLWLYYKCHKAHVLISASRA